MMKKGQSDFGKAHRFWIENGKIPCYENVDDDGKRTYEFYYTPMFVKKHLMKQNSNVSEFILSYPPHLFSQIIEKQKLLLNDRVN